MIVFHGSERANLKQLEYSEENSRFGGEQGLIHGAAIYMTFSEQEAQAYATSGSYYKVEVSGEIFDATDEFSMLEFVRMVEKELNCEDYLTTHPATKQLISDTISGKTSGVMFARNLANIVGNHEDLYYQIVVDKFDEDIDACMDTIENLFHWKLVKLNNSSDQQWLLCIDPQGYGLDIVSELRAIH